MQIPEKDNIHSFVMKIAVCGSLEGTDIVSNGYPLFASCVGVMISSQVATPKCIGTF